MYVALCACAYNNKVSECGVTDNLLFNAATGTLTLVVLAALSQLFVWA